MKIKNQSSRKLPLSFTDITAMATRAILAGRLSPSSVDTRPVCPVSGKRICAFATLISEQEIAVSILGKDDIVVAAPIGHRWVVCKEWIALFSAHGYYYPRAMDFFRDNPGAYCAEMVALYAAQQENIK